MPEKSLSGWMEFPAVMLLDPCPWKHIPFRDMVEMSDTLSWIQVTLAGVQLIIDDVISLICSPWSRKINWKPRTKRDRQSRTMDCGVYLIINLRGSSAL